MSRDLLVAELIDRLVETRCAGLLRENRELRARLAAQEARSAPHPLLRLPVRPRLRVVAGGAEEARR